MDTAFNSWSDVVTYDESSFVEEWLESPQTSLYYSLQVMGDVQDKSDAYAALEEMDVDDYLERTFLLNNVNLHVTVKNEHTTTNKRTKADGRTGRPAWKYC